MARTSDIGVVLKSFICAKTCTYIDYNKAASRGHVIIIAETVQSVWYARQQLTHINTKANINVLGVFNPK